MNERKFRFTKQGLAALPVLEAKARYYDSAVPGLVLVVWPTGRKVFYLYRRVEDRTREIHLGVFPSTTIEQARAKAQDHNAAVARGEDPTQAKIERKTEWTFEQLGLWWLEDYAKARKKSWQLDAWMLDSYLRPLAAKRLSAITKEDMRKVHAGITATKGGYAANRAMELTRAMFNRAINRDHFVGKNPVLAIDWNKKVDRDRRLMPGEMKAFFEALEVEPSTDMRDFVYLSLLTGARQANVLEMRWDEIDLLGRLWRIPQTKNGLPQYVPLEEAEVALLRQRKAKSQSPWVFPSKSKTGHMVEPKNGWRRILARSGLKNLRLHDLRRSLGSFMGDTGSNNAIIGKVLNHLSPASTAIYNRLSVEPLREAKRRAHEAMAAAAELT